LEYRKNNSSSINLSEIGFGAWGIGGKTEGPTSYGDVQHKTAIDALKLALNNGITYYDTSNVYGDGKSEKRIADAFSSIRDEVVIGTKAGLVSYASKPQFDVKSLESSIHSSLSRLKTEYIDILYLHNITINELESEKELITFIEGLKSDGKIRALGLSLPSLNSAKHLIEIFNPDFLQFNFNMMDWRLVDEGYLDFCELKGCSIVARTPLAGGFLTGDITSKTTFISSDHRSRYSKVLIQKILEFRQDLSESLSIDPSNFYEYAIRFCLSFKNIVTVIPGILTPQQATDNALISNFGGLNNTEILLIREVYDRFSNDISLLIHSDIKNSTLGNNK
jgi:aryl-alcohol dehydrogenase-like predicted oxidoreductase